MKNPRVKIIIKSWDSAEAIHKTHSFILQDWQHKNYWTLVGCGAPTKRLLENIAYSDHLNGFEEIVQIDIEYLQTEIKVKSLDFHSKKAYNINRKVGK